jgi:hypothetical protein
MRYLPSSVSQRDHVVSLGGGDPGRVALWPAQLESSATCRTQRKTPEVHNPTGRPTALADASQTQVGNYTSRSHLDAVCCEQDRQIWAGRGRLRKSP